jgi:hypothetical protein
MAEQLDHRLTGAALRVYHHCCLEYFLSTKLLDVDTFPSHKNVLGKAFVAF